MRHFQDIEKRWSLLFNTSIGVDLRQAIKDDGDFDPCEDGLRSVCWKSFLLNGVLSKVTWVRKLKDSRSGYVSLRDHFLKFIDNPNDLHSSADPLADDETSPWATLRQDEISREEIWQDVIRCNVDNHFFTEPATQRKLMDILFIYSKLNPDTGYRQGMHELLAPILWVVYQDSVDVETIPQSRNSEEGMDFMLDVLDSRYVEHDSFNLFCAVMQTCKTFYETSESRDSSAIVAQSERIHRELLGAIDPDLSTHLEVVGIVPQIFAIRWLRLLFGREFEFKDVLKLWDVLFAESLSVDIIDMACVAILLRLRWQLIDADYTTAITTLTRLNLLKDGDHARAIVKDAVELMKRKSPEAGADVTQLRTGRRQHTNPHGEEPLLRVSTPQARTHQRFRSQDVSHSPSPARFSAPQRQLEGLFANVSSNFQKNAEGWSVQNVSKALKGAVGEARKNFEHLQAGHSRSSSSDVPGPPMDSDTSAGLISKSFESRLQVLEERNRALAKMLDSAQETLRKWKSEGTRHSMQEEDLFNTALAKIQFVSVYLADSDISIPETTPIIESKSIEEPPTPDVPIADIPEPSQPAFPQNVEDTRDAPNLESEELTKTEAPAMPEQQQAIPQAQPSEPPTESAELRTKPHSPKRGAALRPSLAESSFSFMLGEDRRQSSFVRSTPLPEERRIIDAMKERDRKNSIDTKAKLKPNTKDKNDKREKKEKKDKKGNAMVADNGEDGFTLSTWR